MSRVGQNHIYIRFIYGTFGREITKYTVYIRCIYTVLANPTHECFTFLSFAQAWRQAVLRLRWLYERGRLVRRVHLTHMLQRAVCAWREVCAYHAHKQGQLSQVCVCVCLCVCMCVQVRVSECMQGSASVHLAYGVCGAEDCVCVA